MGWETLVVYLQIKTPDFTHLRKKEASNSFCLCFYLIERKNFVSLQTILW